MTQPLSFQAIIDRLHTYWAAQGCTIWQPHSEKVGAGTMNPATVLRVLGPEPWSVAYVEPSFRADDGRYAENPNRMQMHTQYQVILKPDPGNPQELYLGSLEAIGLDRTRHDIRFVEDNWESPALGAWGLGWEVWLDGQEITQFTYFQQAGGQILDPVSVEITYGLERIAMYLQHKGEVWAIDYDGKHSYGEIYRNQEIEHCVYNFELADVERQKQLYEIYKAEADACIARGLIAPAHDYVLRQSHTFNLLDARGAIGVTERAKFFADMRRQARAVSELYAQQRMVDEYPWLGEQGSGIGDRGSGIGDQGSEATTRSPIPDPRSLILEIGSEELPPQDVVDGIAQVQEKLAALLAEAKLVYESLWVTATTRRLVVHVIGLAPRQADEVVEKKGPSLDRAYDAGGNPTKAAQGFARGQGVDVADLETRDNYVWAVQKVTGQPAAAVLPGLLTALMDSLRWRKTMRWNRSNQGYPRPLRWILALHGDQIVPFTWAGVSSGRTSRGPRFADAAAKLDAGGFTTFEVADSPSYFSAVQGQGVILDRKLRRILIADMVRQTATAAGGVTPDDPDLLDEVTDLVEAPAAVLGSFERKFLDLPKPVLIGVMKKHQRYFPVVAPEGGPDAGKLLPYFITIANSRKLAHPEVVREGNEGVIRARYADAAFFYRQDTGRKLESFTPRLATLTFHEKLGSMLDKVGRLEKLAPQLAENLGGSAQDLVTTARAAALCKSDLVTSMVVEMTSLQGIMGETYALHSGETPAVAQAIREHYLPRTAGDATPATLPGLALSLADKIDSLLGLIRVGEYAVGSKDPFGMRRTAMEIVELSFTQAFSLKNALDIALKLLPDRPSNVIFSKVMPKDNKDGDIVLLFDDEIDAALKFVEQRLYGRLREMGFAHDVVEAVLAVRGDNPFAALQACRAVSTAVAEPWWNDTFTAYARCARIVRGLDETLPLALDAYTEEVEQDLHAAYEGAAAALSAAPDSATALGAVLRELQGPIDRFFTAVLVNAEDAGVRAARQALIQRIARLPESVADLSKLQGF